MSSESAEDTPSPICSPDPKASSSQPLMHGASHSSCGSQGIRESGKQSLPMHQDLLTLILGFQGLMGWSGCGGLGFGVFGLWLHLAHHGLAANLRVSLASPTKPQDLLLAS